MVTTRGATKAAAQSPVVPATSDSTGLPGNSKNASNPRKSDVLPTGPQGQDLNARPVSRNVTGKRKRASGAREAHVSPLSKAKHSQDLVELPPTDESSSFDSHSLQTFLDRIKSHLKCGSCGQEQSNRIDIHSQVESRCPPSTDGSKRQTKENLPPSLVLSTIHCPTNYCAGITCLGCGQDISKDLKGHSLHGCDDGWYVSLWMQLAYSNAASAKELDHATARRSSFKSNISKTSQRPKPSKAAPTGTGYASGNQSYADIDDSQAKQQLVDEQEAADKRDTVIFKLLQSLMWNKPAYSLEAPVSVDQGEPPTKRVKRSRKSTGEQELPRGSLLDKVLLPTLFRWSNVPQKLAILLRNDSLEEAMNRSELYDAALGLTEALLDSEDLVSMVTTKTFDAAKAVETAPATTYSAFPSLVNEPGMSEPSFHAKEEHYGQSVADALDNMLMACDSFNTAATAMPKIYKDRSSKAMLDLANRFKALGQRLGKEVSKPKSSDSKAMPHCTPSSDRFAMVEEGDITKRFMRHKETNFKISSSSTTHHRMRTLHKEVGILRTSLPQGMWVKMAGDRPDLIKCLIVGPEGTPYEGGLFEFDVFCTKDYPRSPPKVECATAARDEARPFSLNPNLYNTGYVCLSVINTWSGAKNEQWLPGKSTILQVLISIQSMVLGTATPADNEPGGMGISHEQYNRGVQPGTIKAAILPWLQAAELRKGIWAEEIEAYFKACAHPILQTVKSWAKENKRIREFPGYSFHHFGFEDLGPPPPPNAPAASSGAQTAGGTTAPPADPPIPTAILQDLQQAAAGLDSDEDDDFYDMAVPPMPPGSAQAEAGAKQGKDGKAKIPTVDLAAELEKAMSEFLTA